MSVIFSFKTFSSERLSPIRILMATGSIVSFLDILSAINLSQCYSRKIHEV